MSGQFNQGQILTADELNSALASSTTTVGTVNAIANGTAPDAGTLTGSETVPASRGAGLLQTTLTKIAQWVTQTYQGFTQSGTGSVARTLQSKAADLLNAADKGASTSASDNSTAFNNAISGGVAVQVSDGTWQMTSFAGSSSVPIKVAGASQYGTILKETSTTNPAVFSATSVNGSEISNLSIDATASGLSSNGFPISFVDVNDTIVENVAIVGVAGQGTGAIAYVSSNPTVTNIRYLDMKVTGNNALATNTNGTLIVNGLYSQQRGIYVDSVDEFAIEYKNATAYSLISDAISNNSQVAITYGQTSGAGPSYNACSNVIGKDFAVGFSLGAAQYNVFANAVLSIQNPWITGVKRGISTLNSSNYNSFYNILFTGSFTDPINHGSNYNYVSCSAHTTGGILVLQSGAQGNVTAIDHPGSSRTSIYSGAITNSSGNAISGSTANPVYCHATGEYIGSLSGVWRWVQALSGTTIQNSSHKWVYEGTGTVLATILTDGSGTPGYSVSKSGETHSIIYSWASEYWQIDAGATPTSYRFSAASINTSADNIASLGNAVFRFSNVYSVLGTFSGNVSVTAVGSGLLVKEGSNAKQGVATLASGTVVVSNTSVTASSRIQLTAQDNNSVGALRVAARTAGTSFTITSSSGTDSGVVAYEIFEPA